jgi:hypothetical protein
MRCSSAFIIVARSMRASRSSVLAAASTLATYCADQSFAMSVRLRDPHRRLQDRQTGARQHVLDLFGEDAVTIVNQKSVSWVSWRRHSQLLAGPLGDRRGVSGYDGTHKSGRCAAPTVAEILHSVNATDGRS